MGVSTVVYHRAYVSDDALSTQPRATTRRPCGSASWPPPRPGAPYVFGANGGGPATLLDFTKPATRCAGGEQRLELLLDAGADGFMQDFGEQVQEDMRFADGSTGQHDAQPLPGDLAPR